MPDYEEMYRVLFQETTRAISALQKAQRQTEEMYIDDDPPNGFDLRSANTSANPEDEKKHPPQE